MKKPIIWISVLIIVFSLAGCSFGNKSSETGDLPPTITLFDRNYVAPYMPVEDVPDEYTYIGDLSEETANDTGLAGCKMYAVKEKDSFDDFYLYQECGTPIDGNTVDTTQLQWAYVQWIVSE